VNDSTERKDTRVADLIFVVLTIAAFALVVAVLRGVARL